MSIFFSFKFSEPDIFADIPGKMVTRVEGRLMESVLMLSGAVKELR